MHCRHHPTCPGCPLLERSYADQLVAKRRRLQGVLDLYPQLEAGAVPPVQPAVRQEGYRHRLKLPVARTKKGVNIGLYGPKRRVLHTPDCPVLHPALQAALPPIADWLRTKRGVHSLDLRVTAHKGELQAIFACQGGDLHGGPRGARELMRRVPGLASVAVSTADPRGKKVMGRRPRVVAGQAALTETIGTTDYQLHPGAFFQVDPVNALQIHELVKGWVGGARRVLDLYAGVGAYARMLAKPGRKLTVVEEVPQAIAAATAGSPPGLRVVTGRVEDQRFPHRFDAVVMNPARKGATPSVMEALARITDRLIYVSCGPETLARDLDVAAVHGLRVKELRAVDLFPQTPEVEAVVLLERGAPQTSWTWDGARARGPWQGRPSGAVGRASELIVLCIGVPNKTLTIPGARWELLGEVATHGLLRIETRGKGRDVVRSLASRGHPPAGQHGPTAGFFAAKANLQRPFVHVRRAGGAAVPLHGDLVTALRSLGASRRLITRAGGPR
jgi:23S rRNA (uracil1939-C5)-methyltransferase